MKIARRNHSVLSSAWKGPTGAVAGADSRVVQVGLRIIGPAHYGVSLTLTAPAPRAPVPTGKSLLKAMEKVGMILDVTHLSDQCFDEALDNYGGPVLASHHNCRALVPDQRQLTDDQIKRLVARGAVIARRWIRGCCTRLDSRRNETRGREVGGDGRSHRPGVPAGGKCAHAAIGTDLDGGFGREQTPCTWTPSRICSGCRRC